MGEGEADFEGRQLCFGVSVDGWRGGESVPSAFRGKVGGERSDELHSLSQGLSQDRKLGSFPPKQLEATSIMHSP